MKVSPVARQRRHTVYFLREIRSFAPVFLDTEADMTQVLEHRAAAAQAGNRYSISSYVLYAAGRVLASHPEANAAIRGGLRGGSCGGSWGGLRGPRIARYDVVNGKLTLDKTLDGQRVVLATVIPDLQSADLDTIQQQVDLYRRGDPATMPEFAKVRALHRLPFPVGRLLFGLGFRSLRLRPELIGTFAVTSLGHLPIDSFHSVGGTTITLGLGHVAERPVVRSGQLAIAPVMRLCLAFDHRVIDGAEAAETLAEIRSALQEFKAAHREPGAAKAVAT